MVFQKTESGGGFRFLDSSSSVLLSIDAGGAATFSSSVQGGDIIATGSLFAGGSGASLGVIIRDVINTSIPSSSVKCVIGAANSGFGYLAGSLIIQPRTGVGAVTAFATEGTERMRVTSGGNILIGETTDAGYKLDVNGTGRFLDNLTVNKEGGYIGIDANNTPRLGFVKKSGEQPFLAFASDPFLLKVSSGAQIFASNTFTTVLSIATSGAATFTSTVTATGFFQSSDERLKDIISRNGDVITYKWKDGRDDKKHVGYSAQEVQKVMPDAVNEGEDGMLSVNYIEVLVAKIAELENRIKQLEK
jgi:hypothetical protein